MVNIISKTTRKPGGRAGSVVHGPNEFSNQLNNLPVLNIPSEKRIKYMKDLDFTDRDVPSPE